jgi:hypothetical protein
MLAAAGWTIAAWIAIATAAMRRVALAFPATRRPDDVVPEHAEDIVECMDVAPCFELGIRWSMTTRQVSAAADGSLSSPRARTLPPLAAKKAYDTGRETLVWE